MDQAGLSNSLSLIHNGTVLADQSILADVAIADGVMLTAVVISSEECYYIGLGRLNVRSDPEMTATILGKLPSGTLVKLQHKHGDWARAIIPENARNFWMPGCPADETCWVRWKAESGATLVVLADEARAVHRQRERQGSECPRGDLLS